MRGLLFIALALLPVPAAAQVAMEITELPGDGRATCQLSTQTGWRTPGEIKATDKATGDVLIDIPAGTEIKESRCVNAPEGHTLIVLHPAFGTQFRKTN